MLMLEIMSIAFLLFQAFKSKSTIIRCVAVFFLVATSLVIISPFIKSYFDNFFV